MYEANKTSYVVAAGTFHLLNGGIRDVLSLCILLQCDHLSTYAEEVIKMTTIQA